MSRVWDRDGINNLYLASRQNKCVFVCAPVAGTKASHCVIVAIQDVD